MTLKMLCMDMGGVIFKEFNTWMKVHEGFGTLEQGKALTKKYLNTDYDRLVEEVVVKLWKGRDATPYYAVCNQAEYMTGVREFFNHVKDLDLITVILSGGSIDIARRVQHDFGVDHVYANELVIKDNKISGEFLWPIGAGFEKKVDIIEHLCEDMGISPDEVIYIGDDENDIEAFKFCGTSVAFNSGCAALKEVATHVVDEPDLRLLLQFLDSQL